MPDRITIASIDLQKYRDNIVQLRKLTAETTQLMAIVKANAYGHGMEEIAQAAIEVGASYIGVVSLGELKRLRSAGISAPILILNYLDSASISEALQLDASITVMDEEAIRIIEQYAADNDKTVKIHLKVDTGMHRAGCAPEEVLNLATLTHTAPHVSFEGVFTHFAESEDIDPSFTNQQLAIFKNCLENLQAAEVLPPLIHCSNSAGIIAFPEAEFTMVRPGLISYGLNPFPKSHPKYDFVEKHFKPILSLKTRVVFIRTITPGESVGYNRSWTATRESRVALLPIGYGDGYRRTPKNAGNVIIAGQYAPIIGSVSMDQTLIDITDLDDVEVGNEVVIIGRQDDSTISSDDIANAYGTINYEVVTALSDRIVREY